MSKIRVAINGFGRIGRVFARLAMQNSHIELVAINDLADNKSLAHLFKYDSVHGKYSGAVSADENSITIDNHKVATFAERNPEVLPWDELNIDIVVESTGVFRTKKAASMHLTAGAIKVIISAPAKGEPVPSYVIGINDDQYDPKETVISNASCTTNCAAPMVKVLNDLCDIEGGFITTVHSYTGDQRIHDAPHKDLRRARAAGQNIIPTSTGAADAIVEIFPPLKGKMDGRGVRVPVLDGSLTELTVTVANPKTAEEINAAFKSASENELKGVLGYTDEPIVSVDIIGDPHSCIFDSELTKVIGNQVQIIGWYDNEYGYSNRLIDLVLKDI